MGIPKQRRLALKTAQFQTEAMIAGDSRKETRALKRMAAEARRYISAFRWCPRISEIWLAYGIGGVIGLFLLKFEKPVNGTDEFLWVVVGDLPSAFFVVDEASNGSEALNVYCQLMEVWAESVLKGSNLSKVFPVQAETTVENVELLKRRIRFLRKQVMPDVKLGPKIKN
jgi:hypothetical protein